MTAAPQSPSGSRYRRSPYLVIAWEGPELVLVNGDTLRRFRVDHALVTLLSALQDWLDRDSLADSGHPAPADELERLARLGILEVSVPGETPIPQDPTYWDPFDLAVHRQSNVGGYRPTELAARGDPPPLTFKQRPPGPCTGLPLPDDLPIPLGTALAQRRSVRSYDPRALTLHELSTVLHHSARIVSVMQDTVVGELALRPFPGGGARSELELYVLANHVDGLPAGAHYYDAREHDLIEVRRKDDYQSRINRWIHSSTGGQLNRDPAVVLLVTAVFSRVMWKYRGIALGLIYKDVGCLFQTLYLAATAQGLAPCAIGGGEERHNAQWLGLDPLVESQVGCFLLGPAVE